MPMLRLKEIRDMSADERLDKLDELRTELLRLKTMVRAGGNVENPARIKQLRKTVARILTIEKEPKPEPPVKKKKTRRKEKQ